MTHIQELNNQLLNKQIPVTEDDLGPIVLTILFGIIILGILGYFYYNLKNPENIYSWVRK